MKTKFSVLNNFRSLCASPYTAKSCEQSYGLKKGEESEEVPDDHECDLRLHNMRVSGEAVNNYVWKNVDICMSRGGTSGCVVAARLAEDPNLKILVLEAGPDSADLENVHMVGGYTDPSPCLKQSCLHTNRES